jgi:hypothetical protein
MAVRTGFAICDTCAAMKSFLAVISTLLAARFDVFSHPVVRKDQFLAREQPKLMADYGRRVKIPRQVLWAQASPQPPQQQGVEVEL